VLAKVQSFFSEVRTELSKVTWPERKETFATAWVVVVVVAVISFYLGFCDVVINKIMRLILR
jgi:preprotein translocase subunit SecE